MPEIKVYSTPICKYCKEVKSYLDEKKLAYDSIDVSKNPDDMAKMIELSGRRTVPVTVIGEHVVLGWDQKAIDDTLAQYATS